MTPPNLMVQSYAQNAKISTNGKMPQFKGGQFVSVSYVTSENSFGFNSQQEKKNIRLIN